MSKGKIIGIYSILYKVKGKRKGDKKQGTEIIITMGKICNIDTSFILKTTVYAKD